MTDQSIEQIARGLSEAQREALRACFQDAARHAPYHMFPNTPANRRAFRGMIPMGMVTREEGGWDLVITRGQPLAMACLTGAGHAVRQHLMEQGS